MSKKRCFEKYCSCDKVLPILTFSENYTNSPRIIVLSCQAKCFVWTKPLERLLLTKYFISVTAALRLDFRKLGNIRKISKLYKLLPRAPSSSRNEHFANTSKKSPEKQKLNFCSALFHMKSKACLKYFVSDCSSFHAFVFWVFVYMNFNLVLVRLWPDFL